MSSKPCVEPRLQLSEEQASGALRLLGVSPSMYRVKALMAVQRLPAGFCARDVHLESSIPRSKVYPVVDELHDLGVIKTVQTELPPEWGEFTVRQRLRYKREHGMRLRGIEPRRYRYSPEGLQRLLRGRLRTLVGAAEHEALRRIDAVFEEYFTVVSP